MNNVLPISVLSLLLAGCSFNSINSDQSDVAEDPKLDESSGREVTVNFGNTGAAGAATLQPAYIHVLATPSKTSTSPLVSKAIQGNATITHTADLADVVNQAQQVFSGDTSSSKKTLTKSAVTEEAVTQSAGTSDTEAHTNELKPTSIDDLKSKKKPLSIYDYDHWVAVCKSGKWADKASIEYVRKAGKDSIPNELKPICKLPSSIL